MQSTPHQVPSPPGIPGNCFFDSLAHNLLHADPAQRKYALTQLNEVFLWPALRLVADAKTRLALGSQQVTLSVLSHALRKLVAHSLFLYGTDEAVTQAFHTWCICEEAARAARDQELLSNYMHVSGLYNSETKKPLSIQHVVLNMLQPSIYWGDEYAISCMQRFLNIKVVPLQPHEPVVPKLTSTPIPHLVVFLRYHQGHYSVMADEHTGWKSSAHYPRVLFDKSAADNNQ